MNETDKALASDLQHDSRRRTWMVFAIAGSVVLLLGVALFVLGLNYDPPQAGELRGARPVPKGSEYELMLGGIVAAGIGVSMLVRSIRVARTNPS